MAHIRPVSLIPRISPTAGLGRWRIFFSILREARRILACGWRPLKAMQATDNA